MHINRGALMRTFFSRNTDYLVLMLLSEAPKQGITNDELNKICVVSASLVQGTLSADGINLEAVNQSNYPGLQRTLSIGGTKYYAHSPRYVWPDRGQRLDIAHICRQAVTVMGASRLSMTYNPTVDFGKEIEIPYCAYSASEGPSFTYGLLDGDSGALIQSSIPRDAVYKLSAPTTKQRIKIATTGTGSHATASNYGCYMFTTEAALPIPAITHAVIAKTFETATQDSQSTIFEIDLSDIQMDAIPTDGICKSLNIRGIRIKL